MKKWWIMVWLVGACATQSPAAGVGVFGSYWDAGDLGTEAGYGALLRLNANRNLFIDLRASMFSFDQGGLADGAANTAKVDVTPLELVFITRLSPAPDFTPYVGGGIGYYIADGDFRVGSSKSDLDIDNELAYFLVGGLDVKITRSFNLFAEAKYIWAKFDEVESQEGPPAEFDIKMNGLAFNVGVIMRW